MPTAVAAAAVIKSLHHGHESKGPSRTAAGPPGDDRLLFVRGVDRLYVPTHKLLKVTFQKLVRTLGEKNELVKCFVRISAGMCVPPVIKRPSRVNEE
ncbi:hypothetical protein QTP88_017114 [Uroleucon formosanum]